MQMSEIYLQRRAKLQDEEIPFFLGVLVKDSSSDFRKVLQVHMSWDFQVIFIVKSTSSCPELSS